MQLTIIQPATEDIHKKMSTQTEFPVNRDINAINQTSKIVNETFIAVEEKITNGTATDLPASEISEDILLEDEETEGLDIKTNDSKSNILDDNITTTLENINGDVCDTTTNETNTDTIRQLSTQDKNEFECKTSDLEISNKEELPSNTAVDVELCKLNNNSESSRCESKLEEKLDLASTDEPNCENNKTSLEETSDDLVSTEINKPVISLKSDKITVNEEMCELSQITDGFCNVDTDDLNSTKDVEMVVSDLKCSDNVVNETDEKEISQKSEVIMDNTSNEILEKGEKGLETLSNDDVSMHEISKISDSKNTVSSELKTSKHTENDEEGLPLVQFDENLIPLNSKDPTLVKIVEEKSMPLQTNEDVIAMEVEDDKKEEEEDTKSMEMDEEVSPFVQTNTNLILPEADNSKIIEITEEKLPVVQENSNSYQPSENKEDSWGVSPVEPKIAPANITDNNIGTSKENFSECNLKAVKENNALLLNSAQSCDVNKLLNNEISKDNDCMQTDDIEAVNLEKEDLEKISKEDCHITKDIVAASTTKQEASKIAAEKTISDNIILDDKNKNVPELEVSNTVLEENENILSTKELQHNKSSTVENENASEIIETDVTDEVNDSYENIEFIDEDDVKIVDLDDEPTNNQEKEESTESQEPKTLPVVCKLSNTLDILSDDEDEVPNTKTNEPKNTAEEKQCINLDDDDDIMLIEEDSNPKDKLGASDEKEETKTSEKIDEETGEQHTTDITDLMPKPTEKDSPSDNVSMDLDSAPEIPSKSQEEAKPAETNKKPLLSQNFLKTAKKNLAGMTRHELEDFCILRIVESIVDRSNLSEIKTKMKTMAQNLEDFKKRATLMTKQNRDLQVVLKSVQEEQKKRTNAPIQPLKITRSVGMQVLMNDKLDPRRKVPIPNPVPPPPGPAGRPVRVVPNPKPTKPLATPPSIPVPRKVPVSNSPAKTVIIAPANNLANKPASPHPNGLRNPSPVQKVPEKRPINRQSTSVTVDLTDDEPPAKVTKNSPSQPVRVVPPQNLLAQQRQFPPTNNARKVYIPIGGPTQQIRAGQAIVMKNIVQGPRPGQRLPMPRPPSSPIRPKPPVPSRHPAPLPESMKQYTPPTWKPLPPAPDLKLSKVENGIVISWKMDGYPEGSFETIASYQLYAYQETNAPPCTALWKKIGDVKALPLPMACTLTQFMAGFKYYFAVRAVDVRSRLGPFSLPGSILLLNKV